ncbi:PREDICTED: increased DNA methylation 1-like [Camelina sativa]|uniref:Increased DNA methylation 1-like n=1 Tax=Camelina sativa TaxID=90675 RepID=A0ABM0WRR8_CAMSA|nr:PREDICTED: increased DNA methylation 1-like [Camelina sativa]XP_010475231.1 PREDICTED: increased DNA methylation 1-like [Camelina sativa]
MERGGASGERSRIASNTPRILKDGVVGRTVSSSTGTRQMKKRSRMLVSDSESSDEFMKPPPPRRSVVDSKTLAAKEKFARKRDKAEHDRHVYVRRRNNEASESLMKMKKLDVFEFDEYDGFDSANLMRKRFDNGSFAPRRADTSSMGRSGSARGGVFDRRRDTFLNGTGSMDSQEEDSSSESDSDEPMRVRLQGRNGVLKVKVNNMTSTLAALVNHQDADTYERPLYTRKAQKREDVLVKPTFRKSNNVDNDSESEESDMSRKSKRRKSECSQPKKEINTKSKSTFLEPVKPGAREERRGRRGGGTEKQRLRERIKGMLTDAGWTIDYKPRRNQSYLDAVYVNPSGTAYWSIIKAYDALRKQLKDEEIDARPRKDTAAVASVSEDIVNKLARKAKKTRIEMIKTKNSSGSDSQNESDGGDGGAYTDIPEERIRSSIKLGGKSTKKEKNGTGWDDLHTKSKRSLYYNNARLSSGSDSHYLHGRKSKKIGRCTLLVRSSKDKKNPTTDGFNPYSGKRTLLSWLIDTGVVQLRQKVQYMRRRGAKVMLEGWITREGIHCVCCSKILTVSSFEIHAGSKLCQPFQNIYLESGTSLLQCLLRAWNMQKDATNLGLHQVDTDGDDPNDDACGICGDGGDLICCDSCPSTYHQSCLGMQVLPPGDWHCPNCTCKFCGKAVDSGGEDGNLFSLLSCSMCERKYHQSCMSQVEANRVQSFGSASSFCGPNCLELFEKLKKYLGVKNELEGGYSWSLIHRVETDSNTNSQLSAQRIEHNSKLAVGLAIMDECFLPIIDRRSGVNLIRNVLYNCGSNFNRINYTGFFTAILERGDEIISAASLRFHGMQLAEMPFIGTRHIYRRQGMCRRLFDAIELAMRSLKVEKMVIPAIPDFLPAWTGNFGFSPFDDSVRKEMRYLNALVFPGIDMLQKPLLHEENVTVAAATGDTRKSEIETEKKSEFASCVEIGPSSVEGDELIADASNCYKNILASDEANIPISVETAMDTIPKPEDELRKSLPGEECGVSSSPGEIILKSGTKPVSGHIGEDTGSSCEDRLTDVNVQADAGLHSQEIQQESTKFQVESKLSSSISGRVSSDLSSITQEAKSEQNPSNLDGVPSCKDNNIVGPCAELAESKDNAFADGFLL